MQQTTQEMEDNMVISSSSSSSMISPTSPTLHQKLELLLQNQQHWWNYAIFWQPSSSSSPSPTNNNRSNNNNGEYPCSLSFVWAEGHFQGIESPSSKPKKKPTFMSFLDFDGGGSTMDDVTTDVEWFYMTSPSRSYPLKVRAGGGGTAASTLAKAFSTASLVWLSGAHSLRSYNCERAKEAQSHGLQTYVCIPVLNGVLELGSVDLIHENWAVVQQSHSLFGPFCSLSMGQVEPDLGGFSGGNYFPELLGLVGTATNQPQPNSLASPSESEFCDSDGPISRQRVGKKRGRRPSTVRESPPTGVNHVEAERQRREKMNSRFYALRSVVPTVTKMDKASLLSDAVAYINDLKDKIRGLESQLQGINLSSSNTNNNKNNSNTTSISSPSGISRNNEVVNSGKTPLEVEIRVMGSEAMIRVQGKNVNHPSARLMDALKQLNLQVHHASVSTVEDMMLQDVVIVEVPQQLKSDVALKAAITKRLEYY